MNILLVYPKYPDTFWSFKYALKFVSQKASFPPLGLLTVSSLLPDNWKKKLINLNVTKLKNKDILWADYVFISAMSTQSESVNLVISKCIELKRKVVAGGPLFTSRSNEYSQIDHLVLNEAEITLPLFLKDLKDGEPRKIYSTDNWADISQTPLPSWGLINKKNYTSMNIQYSRGCPYDCDFCDITVLYGRKPRTKTRFQLLKELDLLYHTGWRGPVFFVDDNFIGHKSKLKKEILPAITEWMQAKGKPFYLNTEATINLADDDELLQKMVDANFSAVFIGIESPNDESLMECNKNQNRNRNLIASVKKIQKAGLEVQGGFIVGFDNDPPMIFDKLIEFIQESSIVTAMVGLLNAPKGTKLEKKLAEEGRILTEFTGNNTDFSINFIPTMGKETLLEGYKKILAEIYSPKQYYNRVIQFLKDFQPNKRVGRIKTTDIAALIKSIIKLGIIGRERLYYWKLFLWSLFRKPQLFSYAILFAIYGFHFRKVSSSS